MLKILQARLQQYMNRELPDVQAGLIKYTFFELFSSYKFLYQNKKELHNSNILIHFFCIRD